MAGMPPEQRKQMQDMLAKQGMGQGGAGGMSMKICMTREMVERNEMPSQQQGSGALETNQTSCPLDRNSTMIAHP